MSQVVLLLMYGRLTVVLEVSTLEELYSNGCGLRAKAVEVELLKGLDDVGSCNSCGPTLVREVSAFT